MDMEKNGFRIAGNPFDVIVEASIAYLRNQLFSVTRFNTEYDVGNETRGQYLIDRINEQYEILSSMTNEEVELCRKASVIEKKSQKQMKVNDFLFQWEQSFPTIYSECNPEYDPQLEQMFLGKSSSDYLRRKSLIGVIEERIHKDKGYDKIEAELEGATDFLDPVVKMEDITSDRELNKYKAGGKLVIDYALTMEDVDFMKSVVKHRLDGIMHTTQDIFGLMASWRGNNKD